MLVLGKRGQVHFVRSTLRAAGAKCTCPLFPTFAVSPVPKTLSHLRLYSAASATASSPTAAAGPSSEPGAAARPPRVDALCRAFERATGWPLRYESWPVPEKSFALLWSAPVNPGVGTALGHLRIERTADGRDAEAAGFQSAAQLAEKLADVLGELYAAGTALRNSEAERATQTPATVERATSSTLAQRLEAVLRGGAAAIGCSAAGAYLLDHDTTHLKLRASWGLPPGRLAWGARPLDEAPADLEALCGHAVVMENQDKTQQWRCPEPDVAAAVCVPISSPQTLLGTLWMLADEPRNFTDRETDLAEIIAGRIASDLQCEALLDEAICAADLRRQLISAEQSQQNSLPQIAPLTDGWEVAGDSWQGGPLGGAFHDWFVLDDNTVAIVAGRATGHGVEAALAARDLQATVRTLATCDHDAASLVQRVDEAVARGSAGDRRDQLCYVLLDADMGRVRYATAGTMGIMVIGRDGCQSLSQSTESLGGPSATAREQHMRVLRPGESLVIYNRAVLSGSSPDSTIDESKLAEWLSDQGDRTATAKIERLRQHLDQQTTGPASVDRTVLVARYRG